MQVDQGGFILLRYTLWWGPKSSSYLQRHHLLVHVYNICAMYMNMKKINISSIFHFLVKRFKWVILTQTKLKS